MNVRCEFTEMMDADILVPHPLNPNRHSERQIELLAKIMNYQGWRAPIVVSKRSGYIVAGHGRLMAAQKLGWKSVPVSKQDFADEASEYSHLIADNKIASLADHDDMAMIDGIKTLGMTDFDFELLGLKDLSIFTAGLGEIDESPLEKSADKKYILEAQFPNDMEMMDVHDDLLNRGYIVKVR